MAAERIGETIDGEFTVVVNKSTVPIGSGNWVESILRDSFEQFHSRRAAGEFAVASNPEFLREGSAIHDTLYPDRIVIGSDSPRSLDVLNRLYRAVLNQSFTAPTFLPRPEEVGALPLVSTDLASAELIKYAANAFLALKISYINEIGKLANKVGADIQNPLDHRLIVQGIPRLLVEGKVPPLKPQIAERTAVCAGGNIVVLVVSTKVEATAFAHFLADPPDQGGLGCRDALNLDGGPSTQLVVKLPGLALSLPGGWGVPNALVVAPRKQ
jgi:hypothetical protein